MASQTSKILIAFQKEGDNAVTAAFKKLGRESRSLEKNFTTLSDKGIQKIKNKFNEMAKGSGNSLQAMRAQKNALMGLRDQADVTGLEFKQLTADITALDTRMRQAGAGAVGFKGKLKGFAKGAGAVAAGGIFGGVEGAAGAGIGLALSGGNPAGAAIGAAVGAQVGMVRQSIGELAEFSAQLALQRKALGLVIGDTNKFNKSQEFLLKTSRKLAIPQDVITRQFTSLTASVVGAGQSVEDAEKVFLSIASGIRGTGGSLEDMKAAMRATSQVFSKGKVSAEELRQQLGERLPGAFTLFADSMDKTPAELDKALEQGKVTLDDFMKFASKLFETYGVNAEILAQGPEAAGDRLKTAMAELKDSIGGILRPIGASFQKVFGAIVEDISKAIVKFKEFMGLGTENQRRKLEKTFQRANDKVTLMLRRGQDGKELDRALQQRDRALANLNEFYRDNPSGMSTGGSGEEGEQTNDEALNNLQKGAKAYFDTIKDFGKQTQDAVSNAFKGMEDALVKFVLTGKLNFKDLARSIIADLTRITVRAALLNMVSGIPFFDKVTGSAKGNVFAKNKIVPYKYGGIVDRPTIFPMADGMGLMGEAGAEAVMPLKRGRDGKLGVQSSGGVGNISVNVNASGSTVEGDSNQAAQLGKMLGMAVQAELIKQKRPGGLLS